MRGGLERWKRGVGSHGVRQALGYAFDGTCDSHVDHAVGVDALQDYSGHDEVVRYIVADGALTEDHLDPARLSCDVQAGC